MKNEKKHNPQYLQKLGAASLALCTGLILQTQEAKAEFYNIGGLGLTFTSEVNVSYDDNIYSDDVNQESDTITNVHTELNGAWNGNTDTVYLTMSGDAYVYADNTAENNEEYRLRADWTHRFTDNFYLRPTFDHRRSVSSRGNPFEDPGRVAEEPSISYVNDIDVGGHYDHKRFTMDFNLSAYHIENDDAKRVNGQMIINSNRDRFDYETRWEPGFIVMPNTVAYAHIETMTRRYDKETTAINRDTDGYVGALGLKYYLPNRLTLNAWAGQLNYDYNLASIKDTKTFYYSAEARWFATDNLETRLRAYRSLSPTTSTTTSAIVTDTKSFDIIYTFAEDWSFNTNLSYSDRDYRHSASASDGSDRQDDYMTGTIGLEYGLNDTFSMGASHEYRKRLTNATGSDLTRNISSVFVRATF